MRKSAFLFLLVMVAAVGVSDAQGPGLHQTQMIDPQRGVEVGVVSVWATETFLFIELSPTMDWAISKVYFHIGEGDPPVTSAGNALLKKFDYAEAYDDPHPLGSSWTFSLVELGYITEANIAIYCELLSSRGNSVRKIGAWAFGPYQFLGPRGGWWFDYTIATPP